MPQLCVSTASASVSSQAQAGHAASFVIWVWSTGAVKSAVTVTAQVAAAPNIGAAKFTVCPDANHPTCKIGRLPADQADELEATVPVRAGAAAGELIELTARVSATGASGYTGTATEIVVLTATGGSAVPLAILPVPGALPPIPGTGESAIDPSTLFPTVAPADPAAGPASRPAASATSALPAHTDSADVPVDERQVGFQLAGLAVLLAAVLIATIRVSVRRPKTADGVAAKQPQVQKNQER
jgi:hypothetical protein